MTTSQSVSVSNVSSIETFVIAHRRWLKVVSFAHICTTDARINVANGRTF
jgi:hypothetical protein